METRLKVKMMFVTFTIILRKFEYVTVKTSFTCLTYTFSLMEALCVICYTQLFEVMLTETNIVLCLGHHPSFFFFSLCNFRGSLSRNAKSDRELRGKEFIKGVFTRGRFQSAAVRNDNVRSCSPPFGSQIWFVYASYLWTISASAITRLPSANSYVGVHDSRLRTAVLYEHPPHRCSVARFTSPSPQIRWGIIWFCRHFV